MENIKTFETKNVGDGFFAVTIDGVMQGRLYTASEVGDLYAKEWAAESKEGDADDKT